MNVCFLIFKLNALVTMRPLLLRNLLAMLPGSAQHKFLYVVIYSMDISIFSTGMPNLKKKKSRFSDLFRGI